MKTLTPELVKKAVDVIVVSGKKIEFTKDSVKAVRTVLLDNGFTEEELANTDNINELISQFETLEGIDDTTKAIGATFLSEKDDKYPSMYDEYISKQEKKENQKLADKQKARRDDRAKRGDQTTESVEAPSSDFFCGLSISDLTADQQTLFDKLNPAERQALSDKVHHNPEKGQFEFEHTARGSLALQDKDSSTNVNKLSANDIAKKAGNGWKLPEDIGNWKNDSERLKLHPQDSDLDAMIYQMPGANDNEKVKNFSLLTGISGWYWTGTPYDKSSSHSVLRNFGSNLRSRRYIYHTDNYHVRLVRSLEAK